MADIRQEALLNEYKGNLFEFLVGHNISRDIGLELDFLKSLTSDFQTMLAQQEQFIREFYPQLLVDLPLLASSLKEEISKSIEFQKINKIQIMGKAALAANDNRFDEADILLHSDSSVFPISIKICKNKSFVNTKSGGMKSFLTKYFSDQELQENFNKDYENILNQMTYDLYAEADIEADINFKNWINAGMPSLPGQLEGRLREIYLSSLYSITSLIYDKVKILFSNDREHFVKSLMPLIGFGSESIIQATTFYQNIDGVYHLDHNLVEAFTDITKDPENVKLGEYKKEKTSFDIMFSDRTLQIRIKAMNKFTSKSYKLNCSVKKN